MWKYVSHIWRSVESIGGTTEEMMMCFTCAGSMPFMLNRFTNSAPYSSTVCVRCVSAASWQPAPALPYPAGKAQLRICIPNIKR